MQNNYYTSLEELPIWNWWKFKKTLDLSFFKKDASKPCAFDLKSLVGKFEQEYLDLFGAPDKAVRLLDLLKKKIKHQADYIQGKKYVINYINSIDFQLEMMNQSEGGSSQSLEQITVILTKFMGVKVNPKETTVIEFQEMLKLLEENNKAAKK